MPAMTKKNKYYNRSRLSEAKFRQIIKYFSLDLNATQITNLTNLNRNTINKILCLARQRILLITQLQSAPLVGQIEVDESYFGARRVKGKRGRGARGKIIVFGLLKRGDKVYTQIIKRCDRATLHAIIKEKAGIDSIINSDGWRGYNGLVDFGYKKHYRVDHSKNEFARGKSHVNGIESFWGYAKTRLSKFRGMDKNMFNLHLKECEFRFNNRKQNLYKILLENFRKEPLN
jgi:transposase-like protein